MVNLFEHLSELIATSIDPFERETEIFERYGQTVSVMVLDSCGFSRISKERGILHFLTRLVMMRQIVEPILETYSNRSFKFEADNVYAIFDHPDDAVRAALDAHEAVHQSKLMLTENEPFRVCIGIGYGKLLYSETLEGYFGEEMNLASKLGEDIAEGGETLLTRGAYEYADPELVKLFKRSSLSIAGIEATYFRHKFES
ncbi:MAG: adenylate/guanylate cyclase domain-containing protein [Proteobacteria bacterium]|nr:adenylate/guanylate cyclase domain-containing protein [Pseudomonadota bacterium]